MRCVACASCWPSDADRKGRWVDPDPECQGAWARATRSHGSQNAQAVAWEALALFAGVKAHGPGARRSCSDKMAALVNIGKILGAYRKDNEQSG